MRLQVGKTYGAAVSDLHFTVISVAYESHDYIKAKVEIKNKNDYNIFYERPKWIKLYKDRIKHWRPVS